MTKILFLDCDGTIREPKSGAKFINTPDDQRIITGADKAIAHYQNDGYKIIGITNQGGCDTINRDTGKPLKSLSDCIAEQAKTLELLPQFEGIYFCPDMKGNDCWYVSKTRNFQIGSIKLIGKFRKPDAGMIVYSLWSKPGIKLADCWMVGDRPEDEQCAQNAGINFMWADIWRDRWK